ncbi:MAG: hypothetical protein N2560_09065 [Ignavibacteria bacterium]|nr:hypothetical protein [Ignavibacteria bacterium]
MISAKYYFIAFKGPNRINIFAYEKAIKRLLGDHFNKVIVQP